MKKLAKWLTGIFATAAVIGLCSCILSVEAATGVNVKLINDTDEDVTVVYATGAVWNIGTDNMETVTVDIAKGCEEKVNVMEFSPLVVTKKTSLAYANYESVSPYTSKIKLSSLEYIASANNNNNNNPDTGSFTIDENITYSVYYGNTIASSFYGNFLGSSLKDLNLTYSTDYTVDSSDSSKIYITSSSLVPYTYKWDPDSYAGTGSNLFNDTKYLYIYDKDGYSVTGLSGSFTGSVLNATGLTKSDIAGWSSSYLYLKQSGIDKVKAYKAAHRFTDDTEYTVKEYSNSTSLGTASGSVLNGLNFTDSDIYYLNESSSYVTLYSSGVTKYNNYKNTHRFVDSTTYTVREYGSSTSLESASGSVLNELAFTDSEISSYGSDYVTLYSSGVTKYQAYLDSSNTFTIDTTKTYTVGVGTSLSDMTSIGSYTGAQLIEAGLDDDDVIYGDNDALVIVISAEDASALAGPTGSYYAVYFYDSLEEFQAAFMAAYNSSGILNPAGAISSSNLSYISSDDIVDKDDDMGMIIIKISAQESVTPYLMTE